MAQDIVLNPRVGDKLSANSADANAYTLANGHAVASANYRPSANSQATAGTTPRADQHPRPSESHFCQRF